MDDKTTLPPSDASEYKFSESEGASSDVEAHLQQSSEPVVTQETKTYSKFSFKNINLRRVATPGIIVLSILFVYAAFILYSSKKTRGLEQQKMVVQEEAAMIQQQTAVPVASSTATAPMTLGTEITNDQITHLQNTMEQKFDKITQQITSDQGQITGVNEVISKTQQEVSVISQQLGQLTTAMQQMLVEIEKLKAPPKAKYKKRAIAPVAYHIRAIVPGRVWIDSANGKSVTLRVGDKLEGYGEVRVISPRQGMVVMSNGSIIQYGVNDF